MKASETKIQPIIEGTKQYVVPLFQRAYSWDKKQWEVLWDDIIYLCENEESKTHFIGSIVTMPTMSVPEGVSKYLLIDGQQRLTTIFVILTLLRDKAKIINEDEFSNEINMTMLVNPYKKGSDYYKLLPTQADRSSFQGLVKNSVSEENSQIHRCYQYFQRKISQTSIDIHDIVKVITNRFLIVSIMLDFNDNPHMVFESLNAKGQQLTQSDLIRNYFFMRIHVDKQEELHDRYWKPMQQNLGTKLTEFIRHYMMKIGSFVKQDDVYFTLKDRIGDSDVLEALEEINEFSGYYKKLIDPEEENDFQIRMAIKRLNRLEVTTSYPFLLNCYHDYSKGILSHKDFVRVLNVVENYIVRRFVCNMVTAQHNKMFPYLYNWAKEKDELDFVDAVKITLQSRDYPKDAYFRSQLIDTNLYGFGERAAKTKLILETLESLYAHKEQVVFDGLTIEHIMPQKITEWWQNHLGIEWQIDHELYLHTMGNLTLTAYNSELSNMPFIEKKILLNESHIELNGYFKNLIKWDRDAMIKRSEILAELALQIWPYFGESQTPLILDTIDAAKGKNPKYVTILGQRFSVNSWRDVLRKTLNTIGDVEPEKFLSLSLEYPNMISKSAIKFKHSNQLNNDFYVNVNVSAKDVYKYCKRFMDLIEWTNEDWFVETD